LLVELGIFLNATPFSVGRDCVVGIATGYGMDGLGIEIQTRRDFRHPPKPVLGPIHPLLQWVPGLSRGTAAEVWRWPTPSSAEVKERAQLYIYSPFCAFVTCSGVNLTFLPLKGFSTLSFVCKPMCNHHPDGHFSIHPALPWGWGWGGSGDILIQRVTLSIC